MPNVPATLLGLAAGFAAAAASAAPIATESFDYAGPTAHGQGGASDGWGGAWSLTQSGPDNYHALAGSSLTYPAGVALTPVGGRIANMSDEILNRPLATAISANPAADREVWVSMLVRKSDTGSIDFGFETADGIRRMVWGFAADEKFRVNVDNATPFFATAGTFAADTPLMVVIRLSLRGGATPDAMALKVFQDGDTITEPIAGGDFDVVREGVTGAVLQRFFIDGNSQVQEVDEIRIGDTFADVAPIPEPASLGVVSALGLTLLRRR